MGTLLVCQYVAQIFAFGYRYVCASTMSADEYGEAALAMSLFVALQALATLEVGPVYAWACKEARSSQRLLLGVAPYQVFGSLVGAVALFWGVRGSAWAESKGWAVVVCGGFIGFLGIGAMAAMEGVSRGRLAYGSAGSLIIAPPVARFGTFVALRSVLESRSTWFASFFLAPVSALALAATHAWRLKIAARGAESAEMEPESVDETRLTVSRLLLRHSLPLWLATWAGGMYLFSFRALASENSRGAVDLALTLYMAWRMLVSTSMSALLPHLARGRSLSVRAPFFVSLAIGSVVFLVGIMLQEQTRELLDLVSLGHYPEIAVLVPFFFLSAPFDLIANTAGTRIQAAGKQTWLPTAVGIPAVATVALTWGLTTYWPLMAIGAAFPVGSALSALSMTLHHRRATGSPKD